MSDFSGVNLKKIQQNYCMENNDLLRYDSFECLVDQFLRATESVCQDFAQKHQFVLNNDKNLHSNEQYFMPWEQMLKKLNCQFDELENEIKDHECELQQLESNIEAAEQKITAKLEVCDYRNTTAQKLHWKYIEKLVCGNYFNIEQLNNTTAQLIQQVSEYNTKKHSQDYLCKILDCHERILRQTDHNLDVLLTKSNNINADLSAAWKLINKKS